MIDYWEAIGRMASNKDLQQEFLKLSANTVATNAEHANPDAVIAISQVVVTGNTGYDIPSSVYDEYQKFFSTKLSLKVLSLMSAGELYITFSLNSNRLAFQEFPAIIAKATPAVGSPSMNYFVALGIVIVDDSVREAVAADESSLNTLPTLTQPESDRIANLAKSDTFNASAAKFNTFWELGCNDKMTYWSGHLHPQAFDSSSWNVGQPDNQPVAAAAATN